MKMKARLLPILFTLLSLPLAGHKSQAVSPPPDGGYSGNNTAEGQNALLSLTTGVNNTAVGWFSLKSNRRGQLNTAVGAGTLFSAVGSRNTAIGGGGLFFKFKRGKKKTGWGPAPLGKNPWHFKKTHRGKWAFFNNPRLRE